jgi:DNA polymerase elongation subunit (family B)
MAKAKSKKQNKTKLYAPPAEGAKILIFDIETAPILAHVWGLWDNNVGLSQMISDWHVLSWSAKWLNSPDTEVMYMDQRNSPKVEDDKEILKVIWGLLDQADVVITQNGKSFDQKKLNAQFLLHGFGPTASYKHIDTKLLAQKNFNFPSYKLEYMTEKFCVKYKKLKHKEFPGHELWRECLKNNIKAWSEMELYNKHDVLSLEELYHVFAPWETSINFNVYHDNLEHICKCGSKDHVKNGFYRTNVSKFQKYRCKSCGSETRDRINLFSKDKCASLKLGINK